MGCVYPPLYREWTAVSCIAAALQRKCWIEAGRHINYPSLYIILVGPPGCGKGSTMKQATEVILGQQDIEFAPSSIGGLGLFGCLVDSERKSSINPPQIINYVERTELTHCTLYAHIDEFRNFVGYGEYVMIEKGNAGCKNSIIPLLFLCFFIWRENICPHYVSLVF